MGPKRRQYDRRPDARLRRPSLRRSGGAPLSTGPIWPATSLNRWLIAGEPFNLRPHQRIAFEDVTQGFAEHDRGKLIMACGSGKTFTALRIAESVAGVGKRVLYLVPSISLFQQSMREWATQRKIPHSYIGICSDTRARTQRRRCLAAGT